MQKTNLVVLKHQRKKVDSELRLNLVENNSTPLILLNKYLGIKIDQNLNWKHHVNNITIKLNTV